MNKAMAAALAAGLMLCGCSTMESVVSPAAGTYRNSIPAGENAGKVVTLDLFKDYTCNMQVDSGGKVTMESGSWSISDRMVTVMLRDAKTGNVTSTLSFEKRMGDLVSKNWSKEQYGNAGLGTLKKR